MKNKRHEKILEIISKFEIETQEDMINMLQNEGYNVTQATVSRDLRELKLTKVLTTRGRYKYTVDPSRVYNNNPKFNNAVIESITSIEWAGNNIVLKTFPGLAQAVASGVDSLEMSGLLGCVGGDDTIIIVAKDSNSASEIAKKLKELMKIN